MVGKQLVEYIIQKTGQVVNDKFDVRDEKIEELEEENALLRKDIAGLPTATATGESIDISDSAEMRLEKLSIGGNTKQAQYSGRNFLNNTTGSISNNGINYTKKKTLI